MKSKTLAEKAAWDFVRQREKDGLKCFELAVINPGLVMVKEMNFIFFYHRIRFVFY